MSQNNSGVEPLDEFISVLKQINKPVLELFQMFKTTSSNSVTPASLVENMHKQGTTCLFYCLGSFQILFAFQENSGLKCFLLIFLQHLIFIIEKRLLYMTPVS